MILLIGSGYMAQQYVAVLRKKNIVFKVITRSKKSAEDFQITTGCIATPGGLTAFLNSYNESIDIAINCVGVSDLYQTNCELLNFGVKTILSEKPAGMTQEEIIQLSIQAELNKCCLYVAYNRRFLSSVLEGKRMIESDGGVVSFSFELSERGNQISPLSIPVKVKKNWFLANTSHVVDLAFFLGGIPNTLSSYVREGTESSWHPSGTIFAGAGVTKDNVLFCYSGNWGSPGSWAVDIRTKSYQLIYNPLESLQIVARGKDKRLHVSGTDDPDNRFKPGLYRQVEAVLNKESHNLCDIHQHRLMSDVYKAMIEGKT
jgi:predicted dehydrogenase